MMPAREKFCTVVAGLSAAGVYREDSEWRPNQAVEMRRNATDVTNKLKHFQE